MDFRGCTMYLRVKTGIIIACSLLIASIAYGQSTILRLAAQSTYGYDSVSFFLTDSTGYRYGATRGSNMQTNTHLYDSAANYTVQGSIASAKLRWLRTYDASDRIKTHTAQEYKNNNWRNRVKYEYQYLAGNDYDSVWEWRWDTVANQWRNSRVQVYTYKSGLVDTIHWWLPKVGGWVQEGRDVYEYSGIQINTHTLYIFNDTLVQWDVWERKKYHYTTSGKLDTLVTERINYATIQTLPSRKEVFEYDVNGWVASNWNYYWSAAAQRWEGTYWHYYYYNTNGTIDRETINYWDIAAQTWGPYNRLDYYYDLNNNLTDIVEKRFIYPIYDFFTRQGWQYNSANNIKTYTKYTWLAATAYWLPERSNSAQTRYYYEGETSINSTNSTQKTSFNIYPNPANGSHVNIETDIVSNKSYIMLYDVQGRLIQQIKYNGMTNNIQLPIAGLPDGNYTVRLHTADKEMTKQLVIAH